MKNRKLTDQDSVKEVLKEMTLEEKARMVSGASSFGTAEIPRLGIPSATLLDGGSGINLRQYLSNLLTSKRLTNDGIVKRFGTASGNGILSELVYIMDHISDRGGLSKEENQLLSDFLGYLKTHWNIEEYPSAMPVNTLLAAAWNPDVAYKCGQAVGMEACAFGVDVLLGTPCVNIQRDPLGGRGFEGYSEDPYLVSALAPHYIRGVKESGVLTNVKHFAANNQETDRKAIQETISERALFEIYFPAFEACVKEGKVDTVMTAYNWINGEACAHNKWLIQDVLRGQWGFQGMVVSDWGGVYDRIKGIQAHNDLTMPISDPQPVVQAVKDGILSTEDLDICVENYLNTLVKMPIMKGRKYTALDSEQSAQAAYEAAAEGMVLLKNDNETLPLKEGNMVKLMGAYRRLRESGVGSGRVHTDKTGNFCEALRERLGSTSVLEEADFGSYDTAVIFIESAGQEGMDRQEYELPKEERKAVRDAIEKVHQIGGRAVLVLNIAGPVGLGDLAGLSDAVLCIYFPGQEGARAAADILCGAVNPSGKLPHTFPKKYRDTPAYMNFPGENKQVIYGEGILVGYRYYDTKGIEVCYPFGYGLSYTQFQISDVQVPEQIDMEKDDLKVSLWIENTGKRDGKEVIQLYVHDCESTLKKPEQELKAFQKVFLQSGEKKQIWLRLSKRDLSSYDPALHGWVCEPGMFEIRIGNSSRNIWETKKVFVSVPDPYGYGPNTDYRELIQDERALEVIYEMLPKGRFTKEELRRQVNVYYPQTVTFRKAFPIYLGVRLKDIGQKEQEQLFENICYELKGLSNPKKGVYRETEIY